MPSQTPALARDLMTQHVYSLMADTPIFEAAGRLLREHFSGAPVVDADGHVVGVLSEHDLVCALLPVHEGKAPTGTVRDWMTSAPITVPPTATVFELGRFFRDHPVRRVPVVESGRLLGLIARKDVLRALHHVALELRRAAADASSPPPVR